MLVASIPAKFTLTFGQNAPAQDIRVIPSASQIGIQAGAASLNDGFPPVCFLPTTSGGIPPFGQDMNGILNQLSAWSQWQAAGSPVFFDAAFAAAIGGYPNGAVLQSTSGFGAFWYNTADNNSSNPDTGGSNWVALSMIGTFTTGDVKLTLKTVADSTWVMMNDGTLGDASSGASYAIATTANLFTLLYNNTTDSNCPLFTSGGVGTTRGAQGTAATAYANHCRLSLPKVLGRALAGAGAGSGLTNRAIASTFGEENHVLLAAELAPHQHNQQSNTILNTGAPLAGGAGEPATGLGGVTDSGIGLSSTPHNTMQPTSFLNVMIKL